MSTTVSRRIYVRVWVVLMLLLFATWGFAELNLGWASIAVAMSIAVAKTLLVVLFFMHVRYHSRLTWIFASAGFVWLLIMVSLTMTDYLTRGRVRPTNRIISYYGQEGVPAHPPGEPP